METRFFRYVARDAKKNVVFKSRMDAENIVYLTKNEDYDIKKDKMIFYVNRGDEDMTFAFSLKDVEKARLVAVELRKGESNEI